MATASQTRKRRRTRVSTLLLLRLFVVLAPILLLQAWVYHNEYKARRDVELQANLEVARAVAASFDTFVADLRHAAKTAGQALIYLAPFPRERATSYMTQLKNIYPAVVSVSWLEPNGLVLASSDSSLVNTRWSDLPWRREVLHGRDAFVSDVSRERKGRQARFLLIQSVRDQTKSLRGIVVVSVDPNRLGSTIRIRRSGGGTISLIDSSGWLAFRLPAPPQSYEERSRASTNEVARRALAGREEATGIVPATSPKGRRMVAEAPAHSIGWVAEADRPEQETLSPIKARTAQSALLFALVTVLGLLLGTAAARAITHPLRRLTKSAREVGADLHAPLVPVSGPTEVADLAQAFNYMAEEIRQRQREQDRLLAEVQRQQILLETVIQHINHGVVTVEADSHRVLLRNDSFERIMGQALPVGADFNEMTWAQHQPDGTLSRMEEWPLLRALTDGMVITDEEIEFHRPNRPPLTVLVSGAPVRDEQGRVTAVVISFHDITERRQAEQERERLQKELLAAERVRAELAETLSREVSHRVKNNLAMIASLLKMQIMEHRNPELEAALRDATGRLTTFASLFEEFQITAGKEADLFGIVQHIANAASSVFSTRDRAVSVDGEHLVYSRQAATNLAVVANELITNAIKYGAPDTQGEARVNVRLQRANRQLYLLVWNSGNPVPTDFDPSRQCNLGLRLVWGLTVDQYGATFSLRSHEGGTLAEVIVDEEKLL